MIQDIRPGGTVTFPVILPSVYGTADLVLDTATVTGQPISHPCGISFVPVTTISHDGVRVHFHVTSDIIMSVA